MCRLFFEHENGCGGRSRRQGLPAATLRSVQDREFAGFHDGIDGIGAAARQNGNSRSQYSAFSMAKARSASRTR